MPDGDERFTRGWYPQAPAPLALLERYVETIPDGCALDIATDTGRNAVFVAGGIRWTRSI